jgi:hypothetical protein
MTGVIGTKERHNNGLYRTSLLCYCPITVATNADGSETESLGNGKITRAVVSYGGENDSDSSELWAVTAASSAMQERPARS